MKKFKWTDKLVTEFVKLSNRGQYGIFEGLPKIEDKIIKFKEFILNENKKEKLRREELSEIWTKAHCLGSFYAFEDWYNSKQKQNGNS